MSEPPNEGGKEVSILKAPRRLRAADRELVQELVARLSAGEDPRPRVDFDELSERQAVELVELSERINLGETDRSNPTFWRLVALASGWEESHFQRRFEEKAAARKAAERLARKRRMPFGRAETRALLLELAEALADEDMWCDDVLVIVLVLMQLLSGRPLISTSTIEGTAETGDLALVVNRNIGLAGNSDGTFATAGWQSRVKFLSEERWLEVTGRGPIARIKPGPRLLALFDLSVPEEAA